MIPIGGGPGFNSRPGPFDIGVALILARFPVSINTMLSCSGAIIFVGIKCHRVLHFAVALLLHGLSTQLAYVTEVDA